MNIWQESETLTASELIENVPNCDGKYCTPAASICSLLHSLSLFLTLFFCYCCCCSDLSIYLSCSIHFAWARASTSFSSLIWTVSLRTQYFHEILNQMNFWPQTIYAKNYCHAQHSARSHGRSLALQNHFKINWKQFFLCQSKTDSQRMSEKSVYSRVFVWNQSVAQRQRRTATSIHNCAWQLSHRACNPLI